MTSPITLPGPIPGLLRLGSPVVLTEKRLNPNEPRPDDDDRGEKGVVAVMYPDGCHVFWPNLDHDQRERFDSLALDLTDKTGQVHAAWWALERWREIPFSDMDDFIQRAGKADVIKAALRGTANPAALRDLCLRLATLPTPEPR